MHLLSDLFLNYKSFVVPSVRFIQVYQLVVHLFSLWIYSSFFKGRGSWKHFVVEPFTVVKSEINCHILFKLKGMSLQMPYSAKLQIYFRNFHISTYWTKTDKIQECTPVGCVPAAHWPYAGVCFRGGGVVSQHALRQTPLLTDCLLRGGGGCLLPGGIPACTEAD